MKMYVTSYTSIDSKEFKAASKYLIKLNEKYHNYLYLHSFDDLEKERERSKNDLNNY